MTTRLILKKKSKKDFLILLTKALRRWHNSGGLTFAGSLSFHTILSFIPLLAVSLATFKFLGGLDRVVVEVESYLIEYLVFGTHSSVMEWIDQAVLDIQSGALGFVGFLIALFTCSRLYISFDKSVQKIWGYSKRFRAAQNLGVFWIFAIGGPIVLSVVLGVFSKELIDGEEFRFTQELIWLFVVLALFLTFKGVPHARVKNLHALSLSLATFVSILLAQKVFVYLGAEVFTYNKFYGSLAALPMFFIWIYVLWQMILIFMSLLAELTDRRAIRRSDL